MIGTHRVEVFEDRAAAGWSLPVFTNSYFDTTVTGWQAGPFSPAWTWDAGAAVSNRLPGQNLAMVRTAAATIPRPPDVATYRVRAVVSVPERSHVFVRVQFGTTQLGASQGSFWRPTEAVDQWSAAVIEGGTAVLEWTFAQTDPPGPEFVWLGVSITANPAPGNPPTYTARVESLVVDYRSDGESADLSCLVDDVSIVHGRAQTTGQPEASAATITLSANPDAAPLPPVVDVGAVVIITTTLGADYSSVRFTGRVTDVALGWDDAGRDTPDAGVGQIVAVGLLSDLAHRTVGDEPWPQELDGTRVARVADLAGVPLDARWSDPGTVALLPRDVDATDALSVMHDAAESAGGIVWTTRTGDLRYADADHRRGVQPALDLDACDVLVTPTWVRNLDGLTNRVSIGYGPEPEEGGEQPRYVAQDDASIARFGLYAVSPTTELAALADAQAMGQLLLVRNSAPVWVMAALPVDLVDFTADETELTLSLDMHDLVRLTGLPAIGTAPTSAVLWIEGWTERLAWGVHDMSLVVSGFCRTSPPPRWNDLSPDWTWDTVPGALTWNDMTCLGPQPNRGRWDDVPASLRWDAIVPPDVQWDQWHTTFANEGA